VAGDAVRIGVVALQGAFREHREVLQELGATAVEVRRPEDLEDADGVVIPGGESTTIRILMAEYGLDSALRERIGAGFPVLGTCAGMIVLARHVDGQRVIGLDALDIEVRRNAFGRQVDSFETAVSVPVLGEEPVHAVFIRAPVVEAVGPEVEVLARLSDGRVVAVQQGRVLGVAFHPELTRDRRFHRYFVDLAARQSARGDPVAVGSGARARGNGSP
jgi:5'-phosphate synthase pdxT subunit